MLRNVLLDYSAHRPIIPVATPLVRHLEIRLPVSGLERGPGCHPERSEGSLRPASQTLRCAQGDRHSLHMSTGSLRTLTLFPYCATLLLRNYIIFWRIDLCQLLHFCVKINRSKCLKAIMSAIQLWRTMSRFIAACGSLPTAMAMGCAGLTV